MITLNITCTCLSLPITSSFAYTDAHRTDISMSQVRSFPSSAATVIKSLDPVDDALHHAICSSYAIDRNAERYLCLMLIHSRSYYYTQPVADMTPMCPIVLTFHKIRKALARRKFRSCVAVWNLRRYAQKDRGSMHSLLLFLKNEIKMVHRRACTHVYVCARTNACVTRPTCVRSTHTSRVHSRTHTRIPLSGAMMTAGKNRQNAVPQIDQRNRIKRSLVTLLLPLPPLPVVVSFLCQSPC